MKETNSESRFFKGFIALSSFYACFLFFYYYLKNNVSNTKKLLYYLYLSTIIIISFGIIGIINSYINNHFFHLLYGKIQNFFSHSTITNDRLRLISSEPGWAFHSLTTIGLPVSVYFFLEKKDIISKILLFICIINIISTKSSFILIYFLFISLYLSTLYVKNNFNNKKRIIYFITAVIIIALISYFSLFYTPFFQYTKDKINYILTTKNLDPSSGVRFNNYITGLNVFQTHPFFGVGLYQFGFYYQQFSPYFINTSTQTQTLMAEEIAKYSSYLDPYFATPKNFFIRILAENGIIGFLLFMSLLLIMLKKTNNIQCKNIKTSVHFFTLGIINTFIDLDSYMFLYIPMLFGLIIAVNNLHKKVNL